MKKIQIGKPLKSWPFIVLSTMSFLTFPSFGELTISEKAKLKNDFRYRFEKINNTLGQDRSRERIRFRSQLSVEYSPFISLSTRFATGNGNSRRSTNQTLNSGFTLKSFVIDRSFVKLGNSTFNVTLGKQALPFKSIGDNELIWDHDLSPEGISLQFNKKSKKYATFVNVARFVIDDNQDSSNTTILGGDVGFKWKPSKKIAVLVTLGYFNFHNIKGLSGLENGGFAGNSNNSSTYTNGYHLYQISGGVKFKLRFPVRFFGTYVSNEAASDNNTAWLIGATAGKAKSLGSIQARYNYREVESDAVVGSFSDSNFNNGNTGGKGHEFGVNIGLLKNTKIGLTYFLNASSSQSPTNYHRLQTDIGFTF